MNNNSLAPPSNKRQISNKEMSNIVDQMGNLVLNEDEISGSDYQRMFEPKRAIFTFGRFQPPTKGHNNLIEKLIKTSISLNARPFVFVSLTQNALKDTKWKNMIPAKKVLNTLTEHWSVIELLFKRFKMTDFSMFIFILVPFLIIKSTKKVV